MSFTIRIGSDEILKDTITDTSGSAVSISSLTDIKIKLYIDKQNKLIEQWAYPSGQTGYSDLSIPSTSGNVVLIPLNGSKTVSSQPDDLRFNVTLQRSSTDFDDSFRDEIEIVKTGRLENVY